MAKKTITKTTVNQKIRELNKLIAGYEEKKRKTLGNTDRIQQSIDVLEELKTDLQDIKDTGCPARFRSGQTSLTDKDFSKQEITKS